MDEFCLTIQCGEGWYGNTDTETHTYSWTDYLDPLKFKEAVELMPRTTKIYYANGVDLLVFWDVNNTTIYGRDFLHYLDAAQSKFPEIHRLLINDLKAFKDAILYSYFGENQIGENLVSGDLRKKVYASLDCKNFQEIGLIP